MKRESKNLVEQLDTPAEEDVKITNLLLVLILLTLFHLGLTYINLRKKLISEAQIEFTLMEEKLSAQSKSKDEIEDLKLESRTQGVTETLLNLPILHFVKANSQTKSSWYSSLETPLSLRAINSLAAALICHIVGMLAVQLLPENQQWRKFIEGRGLKQQGGIPKEFDRVPLFKAARALEKIEKRRLGPAVVVAFFHLLLNIAANFLAIASRLNGNDSNVALTLPAKILHFPLSPFLLSSDNWLKIADGRVVTLLTVANSLLVGLAVLAISQLISGRK